MDFWSRLLSHTPLASGHSRNDIAKDPLRRRHRFEREYGQLLQTWRQSSNLIHDFVAADDIELRIQELCDMLQDESRRPLPHTCLNFSSEKQIYIPIGKIASTSYNLSIIKEAIYFFGTLIESEDGAFVENGIFASSLTNLLTRVTGTNGICLDQETETKVVELAFNITTKIRLRTDTLSIWFRPRTDPKQQQQQQQQQQPESSDQSGLDSHERFKGKTQRHDFPLFYVLMDYIHSEGKVGDFARTGILYIIESASSSVSLEQWIVESDLSTLMATGLGALYSQLGRKLVIDYPSDSLPPILALSDYEHPRATTEIISSCSPAFRVQLDTFLSHLLFWQDVLNHCRSVEVKSTLLEHFQVIFLQQLLYPSLLESSDIDGGSSVAVLTYLRRTLESLDHPDMINLILHYLLALPDSTDILPTATKNAVSAARKRKSMDLATMMAAKTEATATPLLFNLVDLILACLKSHSQQTTFVTLQLVSVILRRHHRYAVTTLLRTEATSSNSEKSTIGAHQQNVAFLMAMAGVASGLDDFDDIYDNILKDMVVRLESHPCSLKLIAPKMSQDNHELPAIPDSLPGAPRDVSHHTIRADDPLLNSIIDQLETFFLNPVDTNVSITEVILDLGTCGYVSLEGWMLRHPDNYDFSRDHDDNASPKHGALDSDTRSAALVDTPSSPNMDDCQKRPRWAGLPRLLSVLQTLSEHVKTYQSTIPRFNDLLQQRREAFHTANATTMRDPQHPKLYNSSPTTPDSTSIETAKNDSPPQPSAFESFAQRILSELGTPSRSANSRSRMSGGGTEQPGTSIMQPVFTKSGSPAPRDSFSHEDTPGRTRNAAKSYYPQGRSSAVASQQAAFEVVDRKILARRVGSGTLPNTIGLPPLDFNKQSTAMHGTTDEDHTALNNSTDSPNYLEQSTVTVSHVLTNTLILQSFLFELAALLQARASLFDEIRFV